MVAQLKLVVNNLPASAPAALHVAVAGCDPLARAALLTHLAPFADLHVEDVDHLRRAGSADILLCDGVPEDSIDRSSVVLVRTREEATDAIAAGARGVLMRTAAPSRIHAAVLAVAEGLIVIDDAFADDALRHPRPASEELIEPLTHRELEVMQLLADGLTNKEIAQRLHISDHTVKFHVNGILGKLGAESRTEAVVHAARLGIVVL